MVRTVGLVSLLYIFLNLLHGQVTCSGGGGPLSQTPRGGGGRQRDARCFRTIWNSMTGYGKVKFEENVISVNPNNVRFFLFSNPQDPSYYEEIVYKDLPSLQVAHFRFGQPWKILIHGYTMSKDGAFPQNAKNAFLEELRERGLKSANPPGYNIVVVDWGPLADPKLSGGMSFFFSYAFAVRNVPTVGNRVGEFLKFLRTSGALESYDKVHIIGFSLGAHVSGHAGNTVKNITGEKVGRITGLDPAGPNFYLNLDLGGISPRKLSKEDGKFVDVYHSSQGAAGIMDVIGHCDFYPNGGGPVQNDCVAQSENVTETKQKVVDVGSCSHNKAPVYYSRSISSSKAVLRACLCDDYASYKSDCECQEKAVFGEYCDPSTRGTFYIDLND